MDNKLIFEKIPAIMQEIEPIAKGRKNQQQGYAYRGVDDVMNELSPILAKHGVFPVTQIVQGAGLTEAISSKSGTAGYHLTRLFQIRLYASDGSFIEGVLEGEASDFGDKAAGKAHSYAYRDFLMKTFVIPTEGDHDTDKVTPEFTRVQKPASDANFAGMKSTTKPRLNDALLAKAIKRAADGEPDVWKRLIENFEVTDEQERMFVEGINS